jgi:hypothetical protein
MRNIYLLPTDKPSRLHTWVNDKGLRATLYDFPQLEIPNTGKNIYITSNEKIKDKDYYWDENKQKIKRYFEKREAYPSLIHRFKIILTTDEDLIKDGIQSIENDFLEWFVKNPSCDFVIISKGYFKNNYEQSYKIIIPKEDPQRGYNELVDLLERLTPIYKEKTDLYQKYDEQRLKVIEQFKKK